MDQQLTVKGRVLGAGKPLVCVPVMAEEKAGILAEAKRLLAAKADMIEWRADAFAQAKEPDEVRNVLSELKPLVNDTILVFTIRTRAQGGLLELPGETLQILHETAAESGAADFIDVEYFERKQVEQEITKLQNMGAHVIASHHNFQETPARTEIRSLLEEMQAGAADVVKLALMPQRMQDVFDLMEETHAFHEAHPKRPLITMSMGRMGMLSRVAGEFTGSCVTFGAGAKASAPGQIAMAELTQVLAALHGACDN